MAKIPVSKVYMLLQIMLEERWGYIWGTAGKLWTRSDQDKTENEMAQKYGEKWIGHVVTDCSGVMVYIWKQFGLKIPHGSNSMVKQGYVKNIGTVPGPGKAAFVYKEDANDYSHIGIVGKDGTTVYEAKGTIAGFVTSKVTDKKWNRFGDFKDVDYSEEGEDVPMPPVSDTYYAEITGDNVRLRSGPGTNYAKVGEANLFKGERVEVLANCDNWKFCRILSDGRQGYIYSKYVSEPIVIEVPPEEPDKVDEYVMVHTEDLKAMVEFCKKVVEMFGPLLEVGESHD